MKNKNILQEGFSFYFGRLRSRTKLALKRAGIDTFDSFNEKLIQQENGIDLLEIRNCGEKTIQEIHTFKNNLIFFSEIVPGKISKGLQGDAQENLLFRFLISMSTLQVISFLNMHRVISISQYRDLRNSRSWNSQDINNSLAKSLTEFDNHLNCFLSKYKDGFPGIFTLLNIALFELDVFRPIEKDILSSYYHYSTIHQKETLTSLGKKYNLSTERIRLIGNKLQRTMPAFLKMFNHSRYLWNKYFKGDFFGITPEIAETINSTEGTHFTYSFINLFLSALPNTGYKFYPIYTKKFELKGIFISENLNINFDKCFNYLIKLNDSKRDKDKQIKISVLLNKYLSDEVHSYIAKAKLIKILSLFSEQLSNDSNKIEVTSECIIFRRNTPKFLKEYLVELLRENNKPMHFREMFRVLQIKDAVQSTVSTIKSTIHDSPEIFGQKGSGCYGLKEWGGYFGFIGDVAEQYLLEKGEPILYKELKDFLCRELNTYEDSVTTLLFHYKRENRFVKFDNDKVGLRTWQKKIKSK